MNKRGYSKKTKHILLSKKTILAAVRGEENALREVTQYYERYIQRLSSRTLYDRYGNLYIYQDPVLKVELQNKLILGILKFRI